jgi:hypothetical protein
MRRIMRELAIAEAVALFALLWFATDALAHGGGPCQDGGAGCIGVANYDSGWNPTGFQCATGVNCTVANCPSNGWNTGSKYYCACGASQPSEPTDCHMYGLNSGSGWTFPQCSQTGPCGGSYPCHDHCTLVGGTYYCPCCCN